MKFDRIEKVLLWVLLFLIFMLAWLFSFKACIGQVVCTEDDRVGSNYSAVARLSYQGTPTTTAFLTLAGLHISIEYADETDLIEHKVPLSSNTGAIELSDYRYTFDPEDDVRKIFVSSDDKYGIVIIRSRPNSWTGFRVGHEIEAFMRIGKSESRIEAIAIGYQFNIQDLNLNYAQQMSGQLFGRVIENDEVFADFFNYYAGAGLQGAPVIELGAYSEEYAYAVHFGYADLDPDDYPGQHVTCPNGGASLEPKFELIQKAINELTRSGSYKRMIFVDNSHRDNASKFENDTTRGAIYQPFEMIRTAVKRAKYHYDRGEGKSMIAVAPTNYYFRGELGDPCLLVAPIHGAYLHGIEIGSPPPPDTKRVKLMSEYKTVLSYPQPFNSEVRILYETAKFSSIVKVKIWSTLGELIDTVKLNGIYSGQNSFYWRPKPNVASGTYIFQIVTFYEMFTGRVVYLK